MKEDPHVDVEKLVRGDDLLVNNEVVDYRWNGVTVTVKDRTTKKPKEILSNINGHVKAGKVLLALQISYFGCYQWCRSIYLSTHSHLPRQAKC